MVRIQKYTVVVADTTISYSIQGNGPVQYICCVFSRSNNLKEIFFEPLHLVAGVFLVI